MKSKGFTLIELLAVIIILVIITLIAIPVIMNIVWNAEDESDKRSLDLYVDAIKNAVADYSLIYPEDNDITLEKLNQGNFINYEGNRVECATTLIGEDLDVYLANCKIDDNPVDYTHGELTVKNMLYKTLDSGESNETMFKDEHGNIRYRGDSRGTYALPDNYVDFNNETWRIIGYIDGHVKLIKDTSIGKKAWDETGGQLGSANWTRPADLMKYLNPKEVNKSDTDGEYWEILTDEAKGMIEKTTWYLGELQSSDLERVEAYEAERSNMSHNNQPTTWQGYVGLMYLSDYGYASVNSCPDTKLNTDCRTWMDMASSGIIQDKWTMTQHYMDSDVEVYRFSVWYISDAHDINYGVPSWAFNILPVINLKSNIKIVGGDGSVDNHFKLG